LPIVNTTILDESDGDLFNVKVEIQFVQSEGNRIVVTRTNQYKRGKDGSLIAVSSPHSLSVMKQMGRDWVGPNHGDDAQYLINNLIPPSLEGYFFFDGERMDDYFKESTGREIRKAVFQISQLELFEKLIEHLTARKSDFLKKARGLGSKAEEKRELLQLHTRSLEVDKEELEMFSQKKSKAEKLERKFSEKLKKSSLEHIRDLEDQRDALNRDLSNIRDQIEDIEGARLKLLHQRMPVIFCYEALSKTKSVIEGRRESGLIPPLYQKIFIENLLRRGKCICASDITEKDEYSSARRKQVKTFLEIDQLSDKSAQLIETNIVIQKMIGDIVSFSDEIVSLGRKLKNIHESREEKDKKLANISQEISQSNIENIRKWGAQRDKYANEKNQLIGEIAKKRHQIERRGNIIRACTSELNKELSKEEKHASLLHLLDFCGEGIKSAQEVKDAIMKKVKEEIEKKTSQQFLSLIWKKDTYNGVCIDDDYNISVPHVSGREGLGTLSAGERQVCALSFMAALNSVSGFEVPIIIDTPLARISTEPSRNIARKLPNYLQGKQVILLVTEKEYSPEVKEELGGSVGKTYAINVLEKERGNLAEVVSIK